jgi:transcriptional regulator with XRE-family HTH domain
LPIWKDGEKMEIGERIVMLREKKGWKQKELAEKVDINVSVMNRIEKGTRPLNDSEIIKIADALDVSTEYLLGRNENKKSDWDSNLPGLTTKDERDIAKKLENILGDLDNDTGLAFDGEPMDDTTRELVRAQIESNLRLAKQLAKKKFTPKKYRKDDSE